MQLDTLKEFFMKMIIPMKQDPMGSGQMDLDIWIRLQRGEVLHSQAGMLQHHR